MAKTTKAKTTTATKKVVKKPATVIKRVIATKKTKKAGQSQFMQPHVTDQTLYWLIFGAAAIIFALWLFSLDAKVRDLYDQIDASMYNSDPAPNVNKTQE